MYRWDLKINDKTFADKLLQKQIYSFNAAVYSTNILTKNFYLLTIEDAAEWYAGAKCEESLLSLQFLTTKVLAK